MALLQASVFVRPVQESDRVPLSNLFSFEPFVHRHLDWKRPLDWLGETPFLVAERKGRPVAALICPPDPPGVAWIRGFAASNQVRVEQVWDLLWQEAHQMLTAHDDVQIAVLVAESWMKKLLEASGFSQTNKVVLLSWDCNAPLAPPRYPARPRVMLPGDLPQVFELDWLCFDPLWRNSETVLQLAYHQAAFATVFEEDGEILGYQISTPSGFGGHLARLGVSPKAQGRGLGYALVHDLIMRFSHQGAAHLTVNTQAENTASLALYKKANFQLTGHDYPVYEWVVNNPS